MALGVEGERVLGLPAAQHTREPDGAERQVDNAPISIHRPALCSRSDGVISWENCLEPEPALHYEVGGSHLGLPFDARAFRIVADFVAEASAESRRAA